MTRINHFLILKELVKLARQQNQIPVQIASLISVHQYLTLYKLFQRYVPKGSKVLDWGTGIGHFSYFLCRSGYKATGFSILEGLIFKSWIKDYPYKFVHQSAKEPVKLPFKRDSFEGVASVGVLEHVQEFGGNEIASLNEIKRILKPGGFFICYHCPNRLSWIEYLGKIITKKFHHNFRYTKAEINMLNLKTGFQLLEVGKYGILPRNSLGRLPNRLAYSEIFARFYDILDHLLSFIFAPFCQNYYFIAKKPQTTRSDKN